jgi:hypothetical protein
MIVIFNYFDLEIGLEKETSDILTFIAKRSNSYLVAKIIMENGLFQKIEVMPYSNREMLDEIDQKLSIKLLENYLDTAIRRWIDFHIYSKPIYKEQIVKKL